MHGEGEGFEFAHVHELGVASMATAQCRAGGDETCNPADHAGLVAGHLQRRLAGHAVDGGPTDAGAHGEVVAGGAG